MKVTVFDRVVLKNDGFYVNERQLFLHERMLLPGANYSLSVRNVTDTDVLFFSLSIKEGGLDYERTLYAGECVLFEEVERCEEDGVGDAVTTFTLVAGEYNTTIILNLKGSEPPKV